MAIGSVNSINPFQKALGANFFQTGAVKPLSSASIFGQNQNKEDLNVNSNIFDTKIDKINVSGNPFAAIGKVQESLKGVAPVNARQNYENGLAPSTDLQNVYAGSYKGKANILNQIAIA